MVTRSQSSKRGKVRVFVGCLLAFGLFPLSALSAQRVISSQLPASIQRGAPIGKLPGASRLSLAIGLPLRNQAALSDLLARIYDPANPDYHRYLSPEEFAAAFGSPEND